MQLILVYRLPYPPKLDAIEITYVDFNRNTQNLFLQFRRALRKMLVTTEIRKTLFVIQARFCKNLHRELFGQSVAFTKRLARRQVILILTEIRINKGE